MRKNILMEDMHRYLLRYVGKYRVKSRYDLKINDFPRDKKKNILPEFDELYIEGKKGEVRHTYKDNILAIYFKTEKEAKSVEKEINKKFSNLEFTTDFFCDEPCILFDAKYIDSIAKIIKLDKTNSDIDPFNNLNLPFNEYKLPSKEYFELLSIPEKLDRSTKKKFLESCVFKYKKQVVKKFGKKFDFEKEKSIRNLDDRAFISYIGLWDDFIQFVKKEYKNIC